MKDGEARAPPFNGWFLLPILQGLFCGRLSRLVLLKLLYLSFIEVRLALVDDEALRSITIE